MMPGISCNCGTFDGAAHTANGTKQSSFHHDGDDQNEKREWRGTVMRQKNFANACNCQDSGGRENPKGDDDRSQRFRLAMTIRMRGIGGTRGKSQPAPNHNRTRRVESRLDSVGDQRIGIPENAGGDFDECECDIHGEADEREADAGLVIARGGVTDRMSVHAKGND